MILALALCSCVPSFFKERASSVKTTFVTIDQTNHVTLPGAKRREKTLSLSLLSPKPGALWLAIDCPNHPAGVTATLRNTEVLPPDSTSSNVARRTGSILSLFEPRLLANTQYELLLAQVGHDPIACEVAPYLITAIDLKRLTGSPTRLSTNQHSHGVLLPWNGLDDQRFLFVLSARRSFIVEATTAAAGPPLEVVLTTAKNQPLFSAKERLEAFAAPPGDYIIRVRPSGEGLTWPDAWPLAPVAFAVSLTKPDTVSPTPKILPQKGWQHITLTAGENGEDVFVGQVKVHRTTRLEFTVRADQPERLSLRYRAPGGVFQPLDDLELRVDPVRQYGWHQLEVSLKGPIPAGERSSFDVQATVERPCTPIEGEVFDVRGNLLSVTVSRWRGLHVGLMADLLSAGRRVARVEVVDVFARSSLVRIVEGGDTPARIGMTVRFPCPN